MQELYEQFNILENKIKGLLQKHNNLQDKYNKLITENKLLQGRTECEDKQGILTKSKDQVLSCKEQNKTTSTKLNKFITDIDECLEILKQLDK